MVIKKTISIILAFILMLVVCLPSFATKEIVMPGGYATSNVTTKGTSANDSFTITIPAKVSISWDDNSEYIFTCRVTTRFATGSKLTVSVATTNGGKMKCADKNNTATLNYSVKTNEFGGAVYEGLTMDKGVKIGTQVDGFKLVPVAEYNGQITFTAHYTQGPIS